MGTYGNLNHNLTIGCGWGFVEGATSESPIIIFSGMTRISKNVALVTENYLFNSTHNSQAVYSYGLRFFGKKIAVDLAILGNTLPYVDFVVKF